MKGLETSQSPHPSKGGWHRLFDLTTPRFGLLATYVLLAFTIVIALCPIEFASGPQAATSATIFSWLPASIIRNPTLFTCMRVVVVVSALAWMFRVAIPISCWLTVFSAMFYWSLRMENLTNGAHIFNVTNMLLLIHAAWFQAYHRELAGASIWKHDNRPAYPRWVLMLSLFFLGWFHFLAGFTKVAESGWGWGTNASLQLWVDLFGWQHSPFGQLMLFDSRLTAALQTGALIIELASILIIFHRWLRYALGIGLLGFYLGVLTTFVDFGFHFNATLVALFLLPVDRLMGVRFLPTSAST